MTLPVGSRVCWDDVDPADPIWAGTVVAPTAEELAYVATWASSARAEIDGQVLVHWDGDDDEDRAWCPPDELQLVTRDA